MSAALFMNQALSNLWWPQHKFRVKKKKKKRMDPMRQFFLMLVIGATVVGCCKKDCDNTKNGSKKEAVQPAKKANNA